MSFNAPTGGNSVSDWYKLFPESFFRVAGAGLPNNWELFLRKLMVADDQCCRYLCDPALLDAAAAIKLGRSLLLAEPLFDVRLARTGVEWAPTAADQRRLRRCLEILDAIATGCRVNSAIVQLLNCPNGAVRSKVVDLLVRWSTNEANVREWLRDPDPRIRANALEALAEIGRETKWIQQLLVEHLKDPNGRVAGNAAVGLYRMGMVEIVRTRLSQMASSEDATIRCSAAWAIGQVKDGTLFEVLNRLRTDPESRVRWHALKSLCSIPRTPVPAKDVVEEPIAGENAWSTTPVE
jgi:hypothetical protein